MKKLLLNLALIAATSAPSLHAGTLCQSPAPRIITPADTCIQYVGRISLQHPERPLFNYPGAQINVAFEGTWLRMLCKPQSGFFMAQIDDSEPFKVSFTEPTMRLFNGQLVVIVEAGHQPGDLVLKVSDAQRKLSQTITIPVK